MDDIGEQLKVMDNQGPRGSKERLNRRREFDPCFLANPTFNFRGLADPQLTYSIRDVRYAKVVCLDLSEYVCGGARQWV